MTEQDKDLAAFDKWFREHEKSCSYASRRDTEAGYLAGLAHGRAESNDTPEPPRTLPDMIDAERGEGPDDWRATPTDRVAAAERLKRDQLYAACDPLTFRLIWQAAEDRAAKVIEELREKLAAAERKCARLALDWNAASASASRAEKRAEEAEGKLAGCERAYKSLARDAGRTDRDRYRAALRDLESEFFRCGQGIALSRLRQAAKKHGLSQAADAERAVDASRADDAGAVAEWEDSIMEGRPRGPEDDCDHSFGSLTANDERIETKCYKCGKEETREIKPQPPELRAGQVWEIAPSKCVVISKAHEAEQAEDVRDMLRNTRARLVAGPGAEEVQP